MSETQFRLLAATPENPDWEILSKRKTPLYQKDNDTRSAFERDYTRILHSLAYRRLKHKTQVFFNISNDHICTRMEHVSHVESVACTISKALGLNIELTRAIAMGHDLGHAPFGHQGERKLHKLSKEYLGTSFFHEKNGLRFADHIELLEDDYRFWRNMNLTYAVRDGIISHCGEVDENGIKPREAYIDLNLFTEVGQYQPATWEGCVVKISDKIAYLGRDIEDAMRLRFLSDEDLRELSDIGMAYTNKAINTTALIHSMIYDICANSSPENGICLSDEKAQLMKTIKDFNIRAIYRNKKLDPFIKYSDLVIDELFLLLLDFYDGENTLQVLNKKAKEYPETCGAFASWLTKYCDMPHSFFDSTNENTVKCVNEKIYGQMETKEIYIQAIIDYISGMTDTYAIKCFNELITY
ncbi:MAG: HD domain-containing protein [Clostridia bacterium]|nr:HD domain-containing protein [Clostridia bacterium]